MAVEPSGLWLSLPGEGDADSLLTGEMSLLLWWLTAAGLDGAADCTGICQEGIFGAEGEGGNCLLAGDMQGREWWPCPGLLPSQLTALALCPRGCHLPWQPWGQWGLGRRQEPPRAGKGEAC